MQNVVQQKMLDSGAALMRTASETWRQATEKDSFQWKEFTQQTSFPGH